MGDTYQDIERRSIENKCILHDGMMENFKRGDDRMNSIDSKLDKIIDMQSNHRNDITHLKDIVENGLKNKVIEAIEATKILDIKIDNISNRLIPIENFSWFQEWMTDMRNNLFKKSLSLAMIGGGIYIIVHFGNKFIDMILKW